MSEFGIVASDQAERYVRDIAAAMMSLFRIPRDEAVGRIRQFWTGESFRTRDELTALFHQTPEHWAKTIYYRNKTWWLNEASLRPAPYPGPRGKVD